MQYPIMTIALRAVRKAGDVIIKYYEMPDAIKISQKNGSNFVTNVDKAAETVIVQTIRKFYPLHIIFIKECNKHIGSNQNIQWIINPLAGTVNFVKLLPHFSVSVAVRINGRTEVAVIYDPMRNEIFSAIRGHGAQMNGYRLRGSSTRVLNRAVLATGFPFKKKQYSAIYMNILSKLFAECADLRNTGSTSLDLAYVAVGRVDGYFEMALKPWDFIAGELIARESGALACDFAGEHNYMSTGNIIVGNPNIVKSIVLTIRSNFETLL